MTPARGPQYDGSWHGSALTRSERSRRVAGSGAVERGDVRTVILRYSLQRRLLAECAAIGGSALHRRSQILAVILDHDAGLRAGEALGAAGTTRQRADREQGCREKTHDLLHIAYHSNTRMRPTGSVLSRCQRAGRFARAVGVTARGSSGQECFGLRPRFSLRTS